MKSPEDSMQALSQAILREARVQAEQVLADARSKVEAIRERAEEEAKTKRDGILGRAQEQVAHICSQEIAAAQLQARTLRLERREKLLDSVFDVARQRLSGVRQWTDYHEIVLQLAREAVTYLGSDAVRIRADEQARQLLTDKALAELTADLGIHPELGPQLEHGTGIVAETLDGHRQYDNTLETRLDRRQDSLRSPVYHLLMGESL